MKNKYVIALDQGTSSCRAIIFDETAGMVAQAGREFKQIYPQPGWIEHDPEEIWECQMDVLNQALKTSGIGIDSVAAIGITNQERPLCYGTAIPENPYLTLSFGSAEGRLTYAGN